MTVILKRPWTRQPAGLTGPNSAWGRLSLISPFARPLYRTTVAQGDVAIVARGDRAGYTNTNSTRVGCVIAGDGVDLNNASELTLLVYRRNCSEISSMTYMSETAGGFWRFGLYKTAATTARFRTRNTTTGDGGAGQNLDFTCSAVGADEVIVLTYSASATTKAAYVNGALIATDTSANYTAMTSTVSDFIGIGTHDGGSTAMTNTEPVYLTALIVGKALSAVEVRALSSNPWQLFALLPRRIWAPAAAGGRAVVAVDTLTVSDSAAAITTRVAAASDTVAFTDSAVAVSTLAAVAVDTVAFSDSALSGASFPATASDTVAFTDSAAAVTTIVAAASDTAAFTDSATAIATITAAAADTFTVTDSAVASSSLVAAASDTVAFTDSAVGSRSGALDANGVDSVSFSDSAAASSSLTAAAADTVAFTDSAVGSVDIVGVADAADTVTFSDSAEASVIPGTQANDGGHDWRTYGMLRKVHVAAEDSVQFSDAAEARIAHQVPFSAYLMASTVISQAQDSITLSDEAQAAVVRHARGIEQLELARTRLQLARDGTPSEAMEGRMANAELALQALWDLLGHLQPPDTQTVGDRIMREYADASKSLGAPVRGTFVRDES